MMSGQTLQRCEQPPLLTSSTRLLLGEEALLSSFLVDNRR
jgi:hypothetical protein